jgi:hypothetical protein
MRALIELMCTLKWINVRIKSIIAHIDSKHASNELMRATIDLMHTSI